MRVKISATEMTDGDAEFVSLVATGANRQPFKMMKSEDGRRGGVMNFTKLFHDMDRRQKAEISPELLAIAVAPGADLEKIKALLVKANLATDEIQEIYEGEGADRALAATIFVQEGSTPLDLAAENQAVVRLSDEIGAVCLVRQKQFQPYADTATFGEAMAAQSFFPGFRVGMEVLEEKLFEIAMKADSGSSMATELASAFEAFGNAVVQMAQELPQSVFKLEELVRKAEDPVTGTGGTGEGGMVDTLANEKGAKSGQPGSGASATMKSEDDPAAEGAEAEAEDKEKEDEGEPAADAATATPEETADESKEKEDTESDIAKLLAAVQGIGEKLDKGLSDVQKDVTALGERVSQAERVAKSADEATRGRVRSSGDDEDGTGVTRRKTEAFVPPLLDTAVDRIE